MKNIIKLSLLVVFLNLSVFASAQCKMFAKEAKLELENYAFDGAYNVISLKTGQNAQLVKTFYSGQKYRILVKGDKNLPQVNFKILDLTGKVLFDNAENDNVSHWDVLMQSTQKLIISVDVPKTDSPTKGCVAALFGFRTSKQLQKHYKQKQMGTN